MHFEETAKVEAHHRGIDRIIARAAADEDEAGPLSQHRCRPFGEIHAAQHEVGGEAVVDQDPPQHERVEIRAVIGQEDERVLQAERAYVLQTICGGIDRVGPREPGAESVPCLGAARLDGGDHLLEAAAGIDLDVLVGTPRLSGQDDDPRRELRRGDDVVHGQLHGPPDQGTPA